jgi:hypothetical protein
MPTGKGPRAGSRRANKKIPYEQGGGGPWSISGAASEWSRTQKEANRKLKKAAKVMGAEGPKRSTARKAVAKKTAAKKRGR